MQKPNLFYSNMGKNLYLKKILSLLLVLSLFGIFYIYSFIILMSIESIDNIFLATYFYILRIGITVALTCVFLFLFYDKNNFILSISKLLLIIFISSFFSGLLAYFFKSSPYWFLKYSIGIIVGTLFYLLYKKIKSKKINLLSGFVSLLALLLCENLERFLIMDPSEYPSVLYIKSFPNIVLWFGIIVFVFFTSYIFSEGFWVKNRLTTSDKS